MGLKSETINKNEGEDEDDDDSVAVLSCPCSWSRLLPLPFSVPGWALRLKVSLKTEKVAADEESPKNKKPSSCSGNI